MWLVATKLDSVVYSSAGCWGWWKILDLIKYEGNREETE